MDSSFLNSNSFPFVIVFIIAIIIAIRLAYLTLRDRRKGRSDQRYSSEGSDLSDFGSGHHRTVHDDGGYFGGADEVFENFLTKLPPVARFLIIEIVIFILVVVGFVAFIFYLLN
jgi:hypothetical protein